MIYFIDIIFIDNNYMMDEVPESLSKSMSRKTRLSICDFKLEVKK